MARQSKMQRINAWVANYNKNLEEGRRKLELSPQAKRDVIRLAQREGCSFDDFLRTKIGEVIKKLHANVDQGPSYEDMLAAQMARKGDTIH